MSGDIQVRFACGHQRAVDASGQDLPVCPVCGNRQVERVTAPMPRITLNGAPMGPRALEVTRER